MTPHIKIGSPRDLKEQGKCTKRWRVLSIKKWKLESPTPIQPMENSQVLKIGKDGESVKEPVQKSVCFAGWSKRKV